MPNKQAVCLLNDSFPPVIDGVANAVKNYAQVIRDSDYEPIVITPSHPEEEDGAFSFPVIRYPSMDFRKMTGYMAGWKARMWRCCTATVRLCPRCWRGSCVRLWMRRWC